MNKQIWTLAAIAALTTACTTETGDVEPISTTEQALAHGVTHTFMQKISHNWPSNKETHVCELSVWIEQSPDDYFVRFAFTEYVSRAPSAPPYVVPWTGLPVGPDYNFGTKDADRIEISGCAEFPCRVNARLTTKANPPASMLGCEIEARYSHGVRIARGHTLGSVVEPLLMPDADSGAEVFRQKLLRDADDVSTGHQCTVKHVYATPPTNAHPIQSVDHVVSQNWAPLWPASVVVIAPPNGWPTTVAAPAPAARFLVGDDGASVRIKSLIFRNGFLAPDDAVICRDDLAYSFGPGEWVSIVRVNPIVLEPGPGMTLLTGPEAD